MSNMVDVSSSINRERRESNPSSDLELANSWLDFRASEVKHKIQETESSRRFHETYEMKPSGTRPSWVEPGSMDASDWDIAEAEYDQYPREREEMLDHLEGELDGLYNEEFTIHDYRNRLKEGDRSLIRELADKERDRRDKIERKREEVEKRDRLNEEKRKGKDMIGVSETESVLKKILDMVETNKVSENKRGENGWELARAWKEVHRYDKNNYQVELQLSFPKENGFFVGISVFPEPIPPSEKREKGRVDIGKSVSLRLKDGRVYDWSKSKIERSYQWGYPDEHRVVLDETFEQDDFDGAKNIISELYTDLEALSS